MARYHNGSQRRALVTGCAGFLGSHLSERLVADGWSVVGVDCFTDYYSPERKRANLAALMDVSGFSLHEADLSIERLDHLVDGVDTVFHHAAQAGVRGSFGNGFEEYVRNNITATQRLLEAAVHSDVSRFVYASSSAVYGNAESSPTAEEAARHPVSPYGMTKVAVEELAGVYSRSHGLPTVGLRYFTAYGPRQRPDMAFARFISAGLDEQPITVHGDGLQMRDFTFVDDVVDATCAVADTDHPGALVYNVGGGSSIALADVVTLIGRLLGRPLEVERTKPQLGDARRTAADLSLAAADFDYRPKVDLETGLAAQIEWLVERSRHVPLSAQLA